MLYGPKLLRVMSPQPKFIGKDSQVDFGAVSRNGRAGARKAAELLLVSSISRNRHPDIADWVM